MFKKITIFTLIAVILLFTPVFAIDYNITAEIYINNGILTVKGTNFERENQLISLIMCSPDESLIYIDDCVSALDGSYVKEIKMSKELPGGVYTLKVKSSIGENSIIKEFYFSNIYFENVDIVKNDDSISVEGNLINGNEQNIDIVLRNTDNEVLSRQTISLQNEMFNTILNLPQNLSEGTYIIEIYSESDDVSFEYSFVHSLSGSISRTENEQLYNALKQANSNLDKNNTGNITQSELEQLTGSLNLGGAGISDINGLQNCVNLKCLYIDNNDISDLSPISDLGKLEQLYANNNNIENCILKIPNLKILNLDNNDFSELPDIKECKNLKTLFLSNNNISNIEGIGANTSLEVLTLNNNQLASLYGIENLINIEHLDLSFNQIEDISYLENMRKLEFLNLSYNEITWINRLPLNRYRNLYLQMNNIDINNEELLIRNVFAFNKVYTPQKQ